MVASTEAAAAPAATGRGRGSDPTAADVCIVGLGAASGSAVHVLAEAGFRIVALEAGPWRTSDDYALDELRGSYHARAAMSDKFLAETPTWRRNTGEPTHPATFSLGRMINGVGGSYLHYGAWLRRFQPVEFRLRSHVLERYGEERLPEGTTLADWPVGYDDLEPYYGLAEQAMGVAGIPGNDRGLPVAGGNPFDGYRSSPYPLPPVRPCVGGQRFAAAATALGYHPFPVPVSLNTEPFEGRPACTYCGWCGGFGCFIDAKTTPALTTIPRAVRTGNLEVRTHCRALRINHDERGRAVSVDYLDARGERRTQRAGIVILSAYTFENVRLLLLSTSARFPRGLANNAGNVGRHFMTKQFANVNGLYEGESFNRYTGPAGQAVIFEDLNADNFDHGGLDFLGGATVSSEHQLQPIGLSRETLPPGVPRWGHRYKAHLLEHWNSIAVIRYQPSALPYARHRLDLDPHVRERSGLGLPVVRITYDLAPNEQRLAAFLEEKIEALHREMGATRIWRGPRWTGVCSSHDVGGLRMGLDPADSVVDPALMTHEVPNLFVLSGAVFPTCPGVNPSLTLQALVWRAAEGIVAAYRHGHPL